MSAKDILETFGKNGLIVETIRRRGQSKGWLQGTSVMGSFHGKKGSLRIKEKQKVYLYRWFT